VTGIGDAMFAAAEMVAVFSDAGTVQRMLDFEAALARAQAAVGLIPGPAADAIGSACRVERIDLTRLFQEAAASGTPAIPLVRMLTALVDGHAGRYVHWGATSQDVVDTAVVLQMRDGVDLLDRSLLEVATACAGLAERHRHTVMAGRTLLQQAVPITFGLKAARWLAMTTRLIARLRAVRGQTLAVQFGGAAGTLASLGAHGVRVMELLASDLGLAAPDLPWHAERDRVGEIAGLLGATAAGTAKMATDIALLGQTEVGEITTSAQAGTGRSSAMPQKRNPVEAVAAAASARLAIGLVSTILSSGIQEHERAAGAWQAEREAVPDLFRRTSGAVEWVRRALGGLEVDVDRMRANLDLTGGLIMAEALAVALAEQIGRQEAFQLVQALCDRAVWSAASLRDVAGSDERVRALLSAERLERAFDTSAYLGSADAFIQRALDGFRPLRPGA
jgi:3-carboxy-cis,cis-muconate cycloisomerase